MFSFTTLLYSEVQRLLAKESEAERVGKRGLKISTVPCAYVYNGHFLYI